MMCSPFSKWSLPLHRSVVAPLIGGFAAALGALILVGTLSYRSLVQLENESAARNRANLNLLRFDAVLKDLLNAETGQRGYLVTGESHYLGPYQTALTTLGADTKALGEFTGSDTTLATALERLTPLIAEKLVFLDTTIRLRRAGHAEAARQLMLSDPGRNLMDQIRAQVVGAKDALTHTRNVHSTRIVAAARRTKAVIIASGALTLVLLSIAGTLLWLGLAARNRAERGLQESEQQLIDILEQMPVGVFVVDHEGRSYFANRASKQILGKGLAPGAPVGELPEIYQVYQSGTDTPYPAERLPVARAMRGERVHVTDIEIHAPDRVVPLDVWAAPVYGGNGQLSLAVATFEDVTEREHARHEIDALNAQLKRQVVELEAANRLKSEFVANMSHELRTPFNAIIGFAELMHDGKAGPVSQRQQEFLRDILTAARNLLQILNDVLDLSKVEAGKLELRPEPVRLAAVIAEVQDTVRTLAEQKHLVIEIAQAPEIVDIIADPTKLKQVLYNYVSNAVKFTPEGGRIVIRVLPEGVDAFRIEVQDNGIGIRPEDMSRLFVEFQQLDASSAKQYPGTGLGLALTKRIVESQGGRVGVRSTYGEGSTFHAILPRVARVVQKPIPIHSEA
jgi:signal transduction histidine kinase/CHASE3 domain sensor protein